MKRTALIFTLFFLSACEDRVRPPSERVAKDAPSGVPVSEEKPPAANEGRPRVLLTAAEFHSELATRHLSPVHLRVKRGKGAAAPAQPGPPPQLQFTRVEGGVDSFCGALGAGPIKCWGKDSRVFSGRFTDLALGGYGYCGVDLGGRITCEKLTPPKGKYSSVVASGGNYCALTTSGEVRCFGPDASPPLENQRAEFLVVGGKFACAADPTRRLVCWGADAPLLPVDPIRVADLAAGTSFLCALDEDGHPRCFGRGPRLPKGKYSSLDAGFETLCGITRSGSGICDGEVQTRISDSVRMFAVAKASVCALRQDGTIECRGDESSGQLEVPRRGKEDGNPTRKGDRNAAPRVDAELWLRFIKRFPSRPLPLTFDEKGSVSLGDRVPPEFEPLLGADPNRYRSGIGVELSHGILGLTLFDLEERVLRLFLFRDRRRMDSLELLRLDREELENEKAEGTISGRIVRGLRTLITSPSTIEASAFEGRETRRRVKPADDSHSEAKVECAIDKSSRVIRLRPSGAPESGETTTKRVYESSDGGCGTRFPFGAD